MQLEVLPSVSHQFGPPFHTSYSSVSMRSLSVIVHLTYGQCPEHLRLTRCMSGSGPAVNRSHWTSKDANWTSTRQGTHEFQGGARWLSGRVSDSGARGRGFETYLRRVVSLSKTLYSLKVLVNYPGSGGSVPT